MQFLPVGSGPDENRMGAGDLSVTLTRRSSDEALEAECVLRLEDVEYYEDPCPDPAREPVRVGEYDGELAGDATVLVYLEDDVTLVVTATGALGLDREDLLRLAAGVHLTSYATVPARRGGVAG